MNVAISSPNARAEEAIRQLLSPWDITYVRTEKAHVTISYDREPEEGNAEIVIPSEGQEFHKWLKEKRILHFRKKEMKTNVQATPEIQLSITPEDTYCYTVGETEKAVALLENENLVLLNIDVIGEYARRMEAVMRPKISTIYNIVTRTPVSYGVIPSRIRNLVLRSGAPRSDSFEAHLSLDALRYQLAQALRIATGREPRKKLWNGKKCVCLVTHDVETSNGLHRAAKIKRVEEKYGVQSAWYIPTEEYRLDKSTLRELVNQGELGAHDTRHDGRLIHVTRGKITQRVSKAKETLERIVGEEIVGFRAPLLQHSGKILEALREAGYKYDTSIPSWEPNHPLTMKPHGIETVYPLTLEGMTEIPVTLPQDHQLLYCYNMTAEEILDTWTKAMATIRELEGVVTLAVHPDYQLASEYLDTYEELLNNILADNQTKMTIPKKIFGETAHKDE